MSDREALFAVLRALIPPGGDIGYPALLDALKTVGHDTAGVGSTLGPLHFRDYRGEWRGSEFVVYRVPTFDDDVAGDWTEGLLRVKRREGESHRPLATDCCCCDCRSGNEEPV